MSERAGLDLLVTTGNPSFTAAMSDELATVGAVREVTVVESAERVATRARKPTVDGVIVDDRVDAPVEVIDRVTTIDGTAVVLLTGGEIDRSTVTRAFDAGVTDVFPRTSAGGQCEVIAERIEKTAGPAASATEPVERPEGPARRPYKEVFENVSDGLVIHEPDTGEMLDVNERFCELNGYDRAELIGESIELVTPPGDEYGVQEAQEKIEQARRDGPQLFEWRNQRKDGETFPVEVHLAVVRIEGEERVLASVREISERRRRERELQESERRFRLIAEYIDEIIYLASADYSEIQYINPAYEEIYDRPVEHLYENPQSFIDAAHPDDRDRYRRDVERLVADIDDGDPDDVYAGQYRLRRNGETKWVNVARFPVENDDGTVDRIVGRVQDITERKRREREYEQIFNSVQDAITVHDPKTREMVDVNDTFCELIGHDRETILDIGTTGVSVESEGYTEERAAEIIAEVTETGKKGPYQWMVETRDGERRVTEVVATKGEIGGEDRIISTNRDVTERERRRREFEQIFDGVIDPIAVYDPETLDIVDANEAFLRMVNRDDVASVRDKGLAEFMATDEGFTTERALEIHRRVVETGEPETFEWKGRTDEGGPLWLEVKVTPAEIGGDTVTIASHRDVTERRRREREYEQIFNGVKDAILVIDPETLDILDANDAYLDLVGYDALETVQELGVGGMMIAQDGSTVERGRQIHERVAETGDPERVEWRAETREGDTLWLEVEIAPAVINGDEVNVAIHRDVTERRQLERRFRTIGERVDEVIYLSNIDLNEVLYVNDAYAEIWGRPVEEIYEDPRAFVDAIHPDDVDEFTGKRRSMLDDIQSGNPADSYEFSYRIERPDGELRWIETTGYPIVGDEGEPNRYVAMVEDVTEQVRREQTLETFHEATRELTSADSYEDACRRAVQAAQDVLGFPLVVAYLYDDDTGMLESVAVTDRLRSLDFDPGSFGPGESLPWQVFVEGDAIVNPENAVSVYGPGISPPDILVPLGSHGVMTVGAPDASFDSEDIELAQILAATLEAALNHIVDEETLAEREEELKRQQERAAQLERLNDIIRDIEQATVDQSSRSGIESAVCERLIDVEAHDLVWIGESTVGDDELVVRTATGDHGEYIDALGAELAAGSPGHPAVSVRRTNEPEAVGNIATDVSPGDWRTLALRHGIQSVVAVPIRYETTLHGILTIASGEPDAFDDATRNVLAELGRSIGYAITVTEREAALESEGTTELEFDVDDDGLFMIRGSERLTCEIRLERTVRRSGGQFSMFYRIEDADPSAVVELASAAPSVEHAQVISADDDEQRGLIDVTAPTWFGSVFTDHAAVVRDATAHDGSGTIIVEAPRGADVRSLVEGFQERYPDSDLAAQRQRERTIKSLFELQDSLREVVTARQWEALETAYSAGYFSWPRETSGEEVAELIGVTQPTFNKHLRLAEQAAFQLLLERDHPETED
jgi:PAS domain S-box-containing protein